MSTERAHTGRSITSKIFSSIPFVAHGFGVGRCGPGEFVGSDLQTFRTNQMHGNRVVRLEETGGEGVIEADAFITNRPGFVCHVRSADCVPILVADRRRRAVAAVHAGWRGTVLDIAGEALREMGRAYGTDPSDCVAAIGPRICGECFEVGEEVIEGLAELGAGDAWRTGERRVDLGIANRLLLARAGLSSIDLIDSCTCCDDRFASWRRDGTDDRQVNYILLKQSL